MNIYQQFLTEDKLSRGFMRYLALFSLVTIPLYTYLFATKESPLYYTMSMIGNTQEYRWAFIIWGSVTAVLISFYVYRLYVLKAFRNRKANKLLIASLVFLVATVVIPAVEAMPFLKQLHAVVAVFFALSLTASLYLFIRYLAAINEDISVRSTWMLLTILGISIGLYFLLGNTGIFELFFFFSLSVFLFLLKKWLRPYQQRL
nr:hypothetical protein [Cytophagales bacterium]